MGAKQKGFLKLSKGSLGDNTFAKTKNGYVVKTKKREDPERKTSAVYARSRENAKEFGESSSLAKLIRNSVTQLTVSPTDIDMMLKLTSCMSKIILLDKESSRGMRMPTPGNLKLLIGFNMNSSSSLKLVFNSRFRTTANRQTGEFGISIPSFIPANSIKIPKTATHFKIVSAASDIDFVDKKFNRTYSNTGMMELNETATGDIALVHQLTAGTTHPVFIFLGLEFWQVNPFETLQVSNKKMDPLSVVNVIID